MEEMQFLSVKPLSKKTTRASCADVVILNVMRHNARELQAEIGVGADCGIDASRIHLNVTLYGAATADGVAMAARDAMREHGIVAPRKNATLGIEIIVSLPADLDIDHQAYFRDAMAWAQQHYRVPLLSAILHNDESNPHLHLVLLPVRDGKLVGSELLGDRATMKTMQKDFHEQVGKRYGLRMPAPKKLHSAAERAAGLTLLRATLQTNSALTDRAIDALLVPHAKYPEPLLLALGLAMPAPPVKGSFVAMMTKKMRPEYPNRSFTKSAIGDFGPDIEGDLMGENKMSYPVLGHSVSSPDFPPFPEQPSATITPTTSQPSDEKHAASLPKAGAQWSAAQRSTSDITSATGQIRNTSSAQVQTVSLAQPLKPAVGIAPTSSMPPDQRQPADTLRKVAETPEPPTAGPAATVSDGPTKRARAAANRQPASTPAPGEHAEMGNLVLAQQPTSASTAPLTTMRAVQFLDTLTISQQPTSITSAPRESAENTSLAQMRELAGPATPAPATGIENPLHAPEARATTPATWPPYASAAINSTTTAATTSTAAPDAPQQVEHRQLRPRDERAMAVPQAGDSEHSATVLRPLVDEVQIPHPTGDHHQASAATTSDGLRTKQATPCPTPNGGAETAPPAAGTAPHAEGEYQRQHDDDHLAECWDEQHGEFVTVPSTRARPPRSRPALQSDASSNAPSMPRALPEARASPTALAHQLLAIASATSTNERPKP